MGVLIMAIIMAVVIWLYFAKNPMNHSRAFQIRRFTNWFPLGLSYAFLYMGRYNLNVVKNALGANMNKEQFGLIFAAGTITYALSFFINGPLVDRLGGRAGILIATGGACIANVALGIVTYLFLNGRLSGNLIVILALIYSINMYFQSYGAVSIIKVKAYWFHVRERGLFGAIFGTLLSFGIYFAFDWNDAISASIKSDLQNPTAFQSFFVSTFGGGANGIDAVWWIFWIPAAFLAFWFVTDWFLVKDEPSHAGFDDFDTHDASSGDNTDYTALMLLKKVLTHPILLMVAAVEFTTGVTRNGVLQWYHIYAHEVPQPGAEFFSANWGLLLAITGCFGGFAAGYISDSHFQSRRGPPVVLFGAIMAMAGVAMALSMGSSPITVVVCALILSTLSISVHSLMSGTAAADFGGRKATATASGITDSFVYLGTSVQSASLGYLVTKDWTYWPVFLVPFALLGMLIAMRMWHALPPATKKYLIEVEKIDLGGVTDTPR